MVINWDFSEFPEQVSLNDDTVIPAIEYKGLTINGYYAGQGDDFISPTLGIKFSYDGQPGVHRFISFEPLWDATFSVTFHSSSSTPRTLHIARISGDEVTDVITGTTDTTPSTISVELHAGERYYLWFTGGGTGYITSLHYQI